jgi:hypothetical protein
MALNYKDLTTERQWRGCAGVTAEQFEELSVIFSAAYEKQRSYTLDELSENIDKRLSLSDYKSCLFFVLYALKSGVTFNILSFSFDMTVSAAHKNLKRYLSVLKYALEEAGHLPKNQFKTVEEFQDYIKDHGVITVDASEIPVQRPQKEQLQQEHYSGKKKTYR